MTKLKVERKLFSEDELSASKKLIRNYRKNYQQIDMADSNIVSLPGLFYFYFPNDVYGNISESIPDGFDSRVIFGKDDMFNSLCVTFKTKTKDEELFLLMGGAELLPPYMSDMDETCIGFTKTDKTIKEVIIELSNMGFIYSPAGCLLKTMGLKVES